MPEPLVNPDPAPAAVRVFIALGSNLDDPIAQVRAGFDALNALPRTQWLASSALYRSSPMGPISQPDFVNAVALVETRLSPDELLRELLDIERRQGRVRDGVRWGPRTLDLDLLLYGDQVINTPQLQVPHPGIPERSFVLIPLAELAPDLDIPQLGTVRCLAERIRADGLQRLP